MKHGYWIVVLLVVVSLTQFISRMNGSPLSAWKGGGFGMFSTISSPSSRVVKVYTEIDGQKQFFIIPNDLVKLVNRIKTLPTDEMCFSLLEEVAEKSWGFLSLSKTSKAQESLSQPSSNNHGDNVQIDKLYFGSLIEVENGQEAVQIENFYLTVAQIRIANDGFMYMVPLKKISGK